MLLAAALVLAGCGSSSDGGTKGRQIPDVELTRLSSGKATSWPTGRPLVINFWASWCTPCRTEMPAFQAVHEQFRDRVAIVGVTDDPDLDKARKAAASSGARYPLLVDVDSELLVDFSIAGLPATVFVDTDGRVLGRHLGAMTEAELTKEIEKRYGLTP